MILKIVRNIDYLFTIRGIYDVFNYPIDYQLNRMLHVSITRHCRSIEAATTPPLRQRILKRKGWYFPFLGEFDKYFFPSKLDFALPVFQLNIEGVHVNLDDLAFNFHGRQKLDKGLELANISASGRDKFLSTCLRTYCLI
ncbi:MAG: hypothetical protein R3E08_01875 [Thiotrichaceae bacterium]